MFVGLFEVGVHIADVSFFVHADTALDHTAASRATSVYLVQKVCQIEFHTFRFNYIYCM